jgi:protein-S-isoprenylcysteine O-methyltransferase Ste14
MLSSAFILTAFFVAWALVHSLLASLSFKNWTRHVFGAGVDRWYRLAFIALAALTILPIFPMLALLPDRTLYVVPTPWRWLMRGGQVLALAGLVGSFWQADVFHFLGLSQLFAHQPIQTGSLEVRSFYCYVRHPNYLFSILLLWLTPSMTVNLLTVYILTTLYFYLGSFHEERRLLAEFGAAYQDYQQQVPRLIPHPGRCYSPPSEQGSSWTQTDLEARSR